MEDRNKSVTSLKPSFLAAKKTNIKIHANSKNVNNERVKLNQTKAKNEGLRNEIDGLRKELTSAEGEVFRLKTNIKKAKREAEN